VYPPEKLDQPQFVCNMKYFYARLLNVRTAYRHYEQKSATEVVRHQLTSLQLSAASELCETANSFRKVAPSELKKIGVEHRKTFSTLRSLAKNKSIIITRPDKGRGVVIMDRADYIQKMNTILDDISAFSFINHDPTLDNENELTRFLLVFKKEGFISDQEYKLACSNGSRPARIYGVPKLHKKRENYPLRPVMSATKTVAYGLGKMLATRLNTLRTGPYMIKDRFDFVRKIRKSELGDKTMVSFDVTSLFTNVPLTYTIDLILDKMYPTCSLPCKYKQRSRLCVKCKKRRDFEHLLRIATSKTHFIFDKKMYVQHNGVAMGAPLAPIIADIFMSHLEETLMDRLKQSGVCEWYRYVDDTFVLIEPTTKVENILEILNNFHPSISFTHQPETNGSLPFLDVWVTRSTETKKLQTAVYRKETFTGLMIKWDSFVPAAYKKASIVTMIQRALAICSTYSSLAIEFDNIRLIGLHNGYPLSFIDTRIGIRLSKHLKRSTIPGTTVVGCEKQKMYIEIPYTGAATDSFKKKLSHITGKLRPDLDVRFFARPPSSVQMFLTRKILYQNTCNRTSFIPLSVAIVVIYMSVKRKGKE
jgi:Reverse transcriptase (RNA-dependent DNA polymerase)